jgi:hypothetical protein
MPKADPGTQQPAQPATGTSTQQPEKPAGVTPGK